MPQYEIVYPWMMWAEFIALLLLLMMQALQPRTIASAVQSAISPVVQRRYMEGVGNRLCSAMLILFQIITIGLTALVAVGACSHLRTMDIRDGLMVGLLVIATGAIKDVVERMLHYVFQYHIHQSTYFKHQGMIGLLVNILLMAYLLFSPLLSATAQWIIPACIAVAYIGFSIYQKSKIFDLSLSHICYITLYTLHVEILPIMVVIAGTYRIISR